MNHIQIIPPGPKLTDDLTSVPTLPCTSSVAAGQAGYHCTTNTAAFPACGACNVALELNVRNKENSSMINLLISKGLNKPSPTKAFDRS